MQYRICLSLKSQAPSTPVNVDKGRSTFTISTPPSPPPIPVVTSSLYYLDLATKYRDHGSIPNFKHRPLQSSVVKQSRRFVPQHYCRSCTNHEEAGQGATQRVPRSSKDESRRDWKVCHSHVDHSVRELGSDWTDSMTRKGDRHKLGVLAADRSMP